MRRFLRFVSVVGATAVVAGSSLAAMPAAQAGVAAEGTAAPAAYVVVEPGGDGGGCQLASLGLANGAVTVLPAAENLLTCGVRDLAVAPDGGVWGINVLVQAAEVEGAAAVTGVALTHFDPATGAVLSNTRITGQFTKSSIATGGLAFDGAGTLYAQLVTNETGCDLTSVCLYTLDPATAVATFVGAPGSTLSDTEMEYLAADCGTSLLTVVRGLGGRSSEDGTGFDTPSAQVSISNELVSYTKTSGLASVVAPFADPDLVVVGLDYARGDGTLFALLGREVKGKAAEPTETTDSTTETSDSTTETSDSQATSGEPSDDVGVADLELSLYRVNPATAEVTLVTLLSDPTSDALAIAGSCVTPIVIEPTFTG